MHQTCFMWTNGAAVCILGQQRQAVRDFVIPPPPPTTTTTTPPHQSD